MSTYLIEKNKNSLQTAENAAFFSTAVAIFAGDSLEVISKKGLIGASCSLFSSTFLAPIAEDIFPENTLAQNAALLAVNYLMKKEIEKMTGISSSTESHYFAKFAQIILLFKSKDSVLIY